MSQRIKPAIVPAKTDSVSEINSFFDSGILIARRSTELLSELEPAVLRLFLLLHLALDLSLILIAVMILGLVLLWKLH